MDFVELAGIDADEIRHGETVHRALGPEQRVEMRPELRVGGKGAADCDPARKQQAAGIGQRSRQRPAGDIDFRQSDEVEAGELPRQALFVLVELGPISAQEREQGTERAPGLQAAGAVDGLRRYSVG